MQTSLTAWLKKTPNPSHDLSVTQTSAIPTPPPDEDIKHEQEAHLDYNIRPSSRPAGPVTTALQSLRPLHPSLSFAPITKSNIQHFKRINALLLQIPYPASFYTEIISDPLTARISLLALWNIDGTPKVVGGIRCRILTPSFAPATDTGEKILYISTLTLLSPYRGHGVAAELLRRMEDVARAEVGGLVGVGAHVWTANEEGRRWYARRGFEEVRTLDGYYPRLKPAGAVVVMKRFS